jgi:predicted kinase
MKNVFILMGIPGSGKSTWVKENLPPGKTVVASADHYFIDPNTGEYNWRPNLLHMAHRASQDNYLRALSDPKVTNVVVDNTNTKREFMRDYILAANRRGFVPTLVVLHADPVVAAQRNIHGVQLEIVQRMHDQLENTLQIGFPAEWKIKIHHVYPATTPSSSF